MNETINKKINKTTLIALLSVGGLGLTGISFGIGYAVKPPRIVETVVEPEQPFWIQLQNFQNNEIYTINKNDISNINLPDQDTVIFNYKIGKKNLKYDINTRQFSENNSRSWITPFLIFLNKDNSETSFNFKKYYDNVLIKITEV